MLILWGALIACAPEPDPALTRLHDAMAAWDRGRARLDAGDASGAVAELSAARALDPQSTPLALWLARAQATSGDLPGAIGTLDALLDAHPGASVGWYNRAAYRARAGDLPGAARDLQVALAAGVTTPWAATLDPDFAALVDHPEARGLLPPAPVAVRARGPEGAVFLGGRVEVVVHVVGLPDPPPVLTVPEPALGCLRLDAVVEDDRVMGGERWRELTLRFTPTGACLARVGPFVATLEGRSAQGPAVEVRVEAPPGSPPPAPSSLPSPLPLPSALASGETRAERVGAGVAALGRPDRPITAAGRRPDVTLEWRVEGQTRARGGWWAGSGPVELTAEGWSARVP